MKSGRAIRTRFQYVARTKWTYLGLSGSAATVNRGNGTDGAAVVNETSIDFFRGYLFEDPFTFHRSNSPRSHRSFDQSAENRENSCDVSVLRQPGCAVEMEAAPGNYAGMGANTNQMEWNNLNETLNSR